MKQIVGCSCKYCKSGLHSSKNKNAKYHNPQADAWRKIRRTWKQLGKLVGKLSRGYTD